MHIKHVLRASTSPGLFGRRAESEGQDWLIEGLNTISIGRAWDEEGFLVNLGAPNIRESRAWTVGREAWVFRPPRDAW